MRLRLDKLMVKRGFAADLGDAREAVVSGNVRVNGIPNANPASLVDAGCNVQFTTCEPAFVSRGARKLERALDAFSIDPTGKVALDIGASTGGFTDLLLKRGAIKVYAIDVGYGQLAWSLRQDERVVVMERQNVRHLPIGRIPGGADLAVIDVSFISLRRVLSKVAKLMGQPGGKTIVALVKPQFEAPREQVGPKGVITDPQVHRACTESVMFWAKEHGFAVGRLIPSPILGPAGNKEFLLELFTPKVEVAVET